MRSHVLLRPSVLASVAAHAAFVAIAASAATGSSGPAAAPKVAVLTVEAREVWPTPDPCPEAPPGEPIAPAGGDAAPFEPAAEVLATVDLPPLPAPPDTISVPLGSLVEAPPVGLRVSRRGRPSTGSKASPSTTISSPPGGAKGRLGRTIAPPRPHPSNRAPAYPSDALANRWEGTAVLTVTVGADGRVSAVEVESSSGYPILDGAAEAAIREWTFSPAIVDGAAADVVVRVPVRFRL